MKNKIILFMALSYVVLVQCEHLIMGDARNGHLEHHTTLQYRYIPLIKRVKDVFFSSANIRPIIAIMAYDNLHSKASATVTAGGIGSTFVNIRLKSERSMALDYDIAIYS